MSIKYNIEIAATEKAFNDAKDKYRYHIVRMREDWIEFEVEEKKHILITMKKAYSIMSLLLDLEKVPVETQCKFCMRKRDLSGKCWFCGNT